MGFFDVEILEKISSNPYTFTVSNFTPSINSYLVFTIKFLTVGAMGLVLGAPISLYLDTNKNVFKSLTNTNTTKACYLPMVYDYDIHTYWQYTNTEDDKLRLPAGTTSVTFTIKRTDDNSTIPVADYQSIYLRMRVQGE